VTLIEQLLQQTSRTFALSIPLLPEPLRRQVGLAYLLFRIADTIEDEPGWDDDQRQAALRLMMATLDDPDFSTAVPEPPDDLEHDGYRLLLRHGAEVVAAYRALRPEAREVIRRHLGRTVDGMVRSVAAPVSPTDMQALRDYCYAVAGIVGELCTELFVLREPRLGPVRDELMELAPCFGEGLQLVNILRDEPADDAAGRRFLPRTLERDAVMRQAEQDLREAGRYVQLLEDRGASAGVVGFNRLNLSLAEQTLALMKSEGAGVKLSRERVAAMVAQASGAVVVSG
jgi:farnesyl-diphosphate farnesyltransferase